MRPARRNDRARGGVSFTGLQGCVRYKPGTTDILYTQWQYQWLVKALRAADVLVTHCPPRGVNDHEDTAHLGIDALRKWLDRVQPRVLIHGHTYPWRNRHSHSNNGPQQRRAAPRTIPTSAPAATLDIVSVSRFEKSAAEG